MRVSATSHRRRGPQLRGAAAQALALTVVVVGLALGGGPATPAVVPVGAVGAVGVVGAVEGAGPAVSAVPVATEFAVVSTGNVVTLQDGARVVLEGVAPAFVAQLVDQFGAAYRLLPSDLKVAVVTFSDLGLSPSGSVVGTRIVRTAPVSDSGRVIAPTSAVTARTPGHWLSVEFAYGAVRQTVPPVMWPNPGSPRQVVLLTPAATATGVRVADPSASVNPGQDDGPTPAFGERDGQVTGTVTDAGGLPMPYRRVLLRLSPPDRCWFSAAPDGHDLAAQSAVVTDAAGRFGGRYLVCLRTGAVTVTAGILVAGSGPHATSQLQTVVAGSPSRIELSPATVRSGAHLRHADLGVVTNGMGEPVAGVAVALSLDDGSFGTLGSTTVTSDAAGRLLVDLDATLFRAGPVGLTATIAGQTQDLPLGPDWNSAFLGPQAPLPLPGTYRARATITLTPVPAVVRLATKPLGGERVRLLIAVAPKVIGPLTLYSKVGGRWQAAHRWTSNRDGTAWITVRVRPGASRPFRVDFSTPTTLTGTASIWVSVTG